VIEDQAALSDWQHVLIREYTKAFFPDSFPNRDLYRFITLVLRHQKEHGLVPLEKAMQATLEEHVALVFKPTSKPTPQLDSPAPVAYPTLAPGAQTPDISSTTKAATAEGPEDGNS